MFALSDYNFHLPDGLIAETAAHPAHNARLLVFSQNSQKILHEGIFSDLPNFLDENTILFFNNSRVLRARVPLKNQKIFYNHQEKNISDGEIFFLKNLWNHRFEALVRPGKKLKIGTKIMIQNFELTIVENTDYWRIIEISGWEIFEFLEKFWELPLPPYIEYKKEKEDDYQSVFAQKNGSVAAPTASLHFSEELLEKISQKKEFLTLHIGLGTFKAIDTNDIRDYKIHSEVAEVEAEIFTKIFEIKKNNKKILAIGTTACRTLESLPSLWLSLAENVRKNFSSEVQFFWDIISQNRSKNWISDVNIFEKNIIFSTEAYITPWYQFAVVDEIITNFHLPESSLLVLVSAFIGQKNLMDLYEYCIAQKYRFFSFGDGMYIKVEKNLKN